MAEKQKDFDFGSRAKAVKDEAIPAVYLFQPAYYVVVENEELNEWQKTLEERVGVKPESRKGAGMRPAMGTYSLCGSTYFSEACDCDEM